MATTQPNGSPLVGAQGPQIRMLGQFIRDLSFENPSAGRVPLEQGEQPSVRVDVNVNAAGAGQNLYESKLELKGHCSVKAGVLYDLEILYVAVLQIEGVPENALEPFLLINVPALLFPYVRRLASDLTREGGFPPLLIDPVDFAQLYAQRQGQANATT